MSSLGDFLFREYGGNVPSDPRAVAFDAIQRYGSGRAAARELGVDEKTIRRWKTGETRGSEHVERYAQEARRSYAETRQGPVKVQFRYAGRTRNLQFGGSGKRMKSGAEAAVAEAYVRGDQEGMAKAFIGGVDDSWYRRMMAQAYAAEMEGAPGEAGEDSGSVGVFVA